MPTVAHRRLLLGGLSPYLFRYYAGVDPAQTGGVFSRAAGGTAGYATYFDANGVLQVTTGARYAHYIGGVVHLLLEPQSTNQVTTSEDPTGTNWVRTRCTVVSANNPGPNGASTARKITANNGETSAKFFTPSVAKAASAATYSGFAVLRVGELTWARVRLSTANESAYGGYYFNLAGAGAIGSASSSGFTPVSAYMVALTGGWFLCSVTVTTDTDVTVKIAVDLATANNNVSLSGMDGTKGLYFFAAQLEPLPFSTSYIGPTAASYVIRAPDVLYWPLPNGMVVPIEMTAWADFKEAGSSIYTAIDPYLWHIGGTGANDRLYTYATSGGYRSGVNNGGSVAFTSSAPTPTIGQSVKLRTYISAAGQVTRAQSLDGAAENANTSAGSVGLPSAFGTPNRLAVNSKGDLSTIGAVALRSLKFLRGNRSAAECEIA